MRIRVHMPQGTYDWESNVGRFRVGRGDGCAIRFEGPASKFASWEHAEFSLDSDGATHVTDLGSSNGTYVDGAPIRGAAPLRVGSTVQIGRAGPRLEVLALTAVAARPIPINPPPAGALNSSAAASASEPAESQRSPWHWLPNTAALGTIVALAALVTLLLGRGCDDQRGAKGPAAPVKPSPSNGDTGGTTETTLGQNAAAPDQEIGAADHATAADDQKADPDEQPDPKTGPNPLASAVSAEPGDPWTQANGRAIAAYRLIVVEDPQTRTSWPFAGSIVVGEHALLTTATVGVELKRFRDRGWSVSAVKPPHESPVPIARVRVYAGFQGAEATEQLYFDLALLGAELPLGDAAMLAAPGELAELEQGQPLRSIAIEHAGDPLDRFHPLNPEEHEGKIFAVTSLPPLPGGPKLLHLRGDLSRKFLGSPIVNDRGHVVALYCEQADAAAAPGSQLHYAKVIDPQLIHRGLQQKNDSLWVTLAPGAPGETQ